MKLVCTVAWECRENCVLRVFGDILKPAASVCPPPPKYLDRVRALGSAFCLWERQDILISYYFFITSMAKLSSPSSADK